MEQFDSRLTEEVDQYIEQLFVPADPVLAEGLKEADAAGLPAIQVSANQGKLLYLLARMIGARRILEIGTLGGYSTIWLARALPISGRLITLELSPEHAAVARRNIERTGLAKTVEIRVGPAAKSLQAMIERSEPPFDLIFIDAEKTGYVEYLNLSVQLSRSGTVILADNVIRNGRVMKDAPDDASARGARAFNLALAAEERLESVILPIIRDKFDGMSISIVK